MQISFQLPQYHLGIVHISSEIPLLRTPYHSLAPNRMKQLLSLQQMAVVAKIC